jgi:hypothetical protein
MSTWSPADDKVQLAVDDKIQLQADEKAEEESKNPFNE